MGRTKRACHLHLILCSWDAVITCTPVTVFFPLGVWLCSKKKKEKKVQLVHSLVPALTLTLTITLTTTLNHSANKPQQTTSVMFSLMYPTTAQWSTRFNMFTTDYKPLCFIHFRKSRDRKRLPFFRVKEVTAVLRLAITVVDSFSCPNAERSRMHVKIYLFLQNPRQIKLPVYFAGRLQITRLYLKFVSPCVGGSKKPHTL